MGVFCLFNSNILLKFIYTIKKDMKKLIMVAIILIASMSVYSQEFLGIKVDGKKTDVVQQFKNKGFIVKSEPSKTVTTMVGTVAGKKTEVNVVSSPISQIVWKFAVYLPEQTSWYSLKDEYNEFLITLTNKYGAPENVYAFFSSPYYEGDGYEMQAVYMEKCTYSAFWSDSIGIMLQISKYKQVKISYENSKNSQLDTQEKEKLKMESF